MISLDISILYQIILFVILWLILDRLLFRPYMHVIEERERRTTGAEHDAADLQHEGARLRAQYEEMIDQAQIAGYAAKDAILNDARQQREKILAQARQEAASLLEDTRRDVAVALQREKQLASIEAGAVAREMVSKILGRTVA